MKESEYHQLIDNLKINSQKSFNQLDSVDDYNESGECSLITAPPDQSQIMLNKQPPVIQISVASKFNQHQLKCESEK